VAERRELAAILLAAGPSSRLGRLKQLVEYGGETLVRRAARMLVETGRVSADVTVVTGCEGEAVAAELAGLPVSVTLNPDWLAGMGGSIAWGARQVPASAAGILVMVCDQWRLSREDLRLLLDSWEAAPERIHVAGWKEGAAHVSGPPVVFPGFLRGELKGLEKGRGARQVIDRHIDIVEFVELQSAGHDLDRPEDLERMRRG
jgi:molybdenum cofactor cytidylyltransferase